MRFQTFIFLLALFFTSTLQIPVYPRSPRQLALQSFHPYVLSDNYAIIETPIVQEQPELLNPNPDGPIQRPLEPTAKTSTEETPSSPQIPQTNSQSTVPSVPQIQTFNEILNPTDDYWNKVITDLRKQDISEKLQVEKDKLEGNQEQEEVDQRRVEEINEQIDEKLQEAKQDKQLFQAMGQNDTEDYGRKLLKEEHELRKEIHILKDLKRVEEIEETMNELENHFKEALENEKEVEKLTKKIEEKEQKEEDLEVLEELEELKEAQHLDNKEKGKNEVEE